VGGQIPPPRLERRAPTLGACRKLTLA